MSRDNDRIGRLFDGCLCGILTAATALGVLYVVFRGII
jgi:hypothetical protein